MFGKLKDKLKSALSIFSRKAEEVAEEKKVEEVVEEKKVEAVVEEQKVEEVIEDKRIKEVIKKLSEDKQFRKDIVERIIDKNDVDGYFEKERRIIQEKKYSPEELIITGLKATEILREHATKSSEKERGKPKEIKKDKAIKKGIVSEPKRDTELQRVREALDRKIPTPEETAKKMQEILFKEEVTEEQPKKSFFGRIKEFVTTKTISAEKFEELFWDLELALLENNVSVEVIEKIKENLNKELVDKPLPRDVPAKIEQTLKETLTEILTFESVNLSDRIKQKKPYIIAFFGINGSGKTTSIAKLTYYLQQKGFSVVLAAADTFRAAAIDQLEEHANKLKVKMIKHAYGSDAAAVAFDAVKYAEKNKIDVVLIDTAGRLHSNTNLMAELEKIIRINKPDLKVFVGESITGNDCIEQARKFNELVELDGSILTKADVDEKGGAPLSIAYTIKKPILFLGTGQKYSDFEEFEAETILGKLGF